MHANLFGLSIASSAIHAGESLIPITALRLQRVEDDIAEAASCGYSLLSEMIADQDDPALRATHLAAAHWEVQQTSLTAQRETDYFSFPLTFTAGHERLN